MIKTHPRDSWNSFSHECQTHNQTSLRKNKGELVHVMVDLSVALVSGIAVSRGSNIVVRSLSLFPPLTLFSLWGRQGGHLQPQTQHSPDSAESSSPLL